MSSQHFRICHISDPHFGTTTLAKENALIQAIQGVQPDLIALTGDITQRAKKKEFLQAKDFCQRLVSFNLAAVPGNHDIPLFNLGARLFFPYLRYRKWFGRDTSSKHISGVVETLALNTTSCVRHIQGKLSKAESLKLQNFSATSLVRVVLFHHPIDCEKKTDEKNLLRSADQTLLLLEKNRVDVVLGCHIHLPHARLSNVRYVNSTRPLVVAVGGTCLSSRIRDGVPNSFNVLDFKIESGNILLDVTRHDLSAHMKFEVADQQIFFRSGIDRWT